MTVERDALIGEAGVVICTPEVELADRGDVPLYGAALSQTPIWCGYRPVAIAAREGTQIGLLV